MEPNNKKESIWKSPYMKVFVKVSGWIVVPVLISSFIGNILDDKFGTAPRILAISLLCSFIVSMIFVVKTAKKYQKDFDKTNNDGNK